MTNSDVKCIILALNDENQFVSQLGFEERINDLFWTYGYEGKREMPDWFKEFWANLKSRRTGRRNFRDLHSFELSFLTDLGEVVGWPVADEEESLTISFAVTGCTATVSMLGIDELGKATCYFEIDCALVE